MYLGASGETQRERDERTPLSLDDIVRNFPCMKGCLCPEKMHYLYKICTVSYGTSGGMMHCERSFTGRKLSYIRYDAYYSTL